LSLDDLSLRLSRADSRSFLESRRSFFDRADSLSLLESFLEFLDLEATSSFLPLDFVSFALFADFLSSAFLAAAFLSAARLDFADLRCAFAPKVATKSTSRRETTNLKRRLFRHIND